MTREQYRKLVERGLMLYAQMAARRWGTTVGAMFSRKRTHEVLCARQAMKARLVHEFFWSQSEVDGLFRQSKGGIKADAV